MLRIAADAKRISGRWAPQNASVEAIAKEIGVSKRTFYRRWTQAEKLGLEPDTPFSQWIRP